MSREDKGTLYGRESNGSSSFQSDSGIEQIRRSLLTVVVVP